MKKLGVITFYYKNFNFGGMLQSYALTKAINTHFEGVDAEQICYDSWPCGDSNKSKASGLAGKILRGFKTFGILYFAHLARKYYHEILDKMFEGATKPRLEKFLEFQAMIPHSQKVYNDKTIKESAQNFDCLVCGGDQIWNDFGGSNLRERTKAYTLAFAPKAKLKFSYAPSIPNKNLTKDYAEMLKKDIRSLDYISVREKSSVPFIEKLSGKKVATVVDPVLLLNAAEWDKIAVLPQKSEKYILCYILSDSKKLRKWVTSFSKKVGIKIVTFPHIVGGKSVRSCDLFFGNVKDTTSGPREFVGLVKNAEMVVTDSFHACVFSMIYHKPFYVFNRKKLGSGGVMNSRIYDFLSEYGLQNQLISTKAQKTAVPKIDFTDADSILEVNKYDSMKYLKKTIENI